MNIGVQLGAASGGLTDVDLDCAEAIALANDLLPATAAVFGRETKKGSHRLYKTDLWETENKAVIKYSEPKTPGGDPKRPAVLVELRIGAGDKGTQTIAPGSVHPSGELVQWDIEGEPATVRGSDLKDSVAALAAAALLVRYYPAQGKRHDAALVLGGLLARKPNVEAGEIERFVAIVARAAGDDEAVERGRSAAGAVDLLKRGEPTPGLPRMREEWGNEIADALAKWLHIQIGNEAQGQEQPSADRAAKTKQADVLIAIAVGIASLFHSADGLGFADIRIHDHRETWELSSKGFRRWLLGQYYALSGGAPSSEALRNAIAVLDARANFDGPVREVYSRVAAVGDKVYLDLGDPDWQVIEIDGEGWRVLNETPVRFRRHPGQLSLPIPVQGGSVDDLRRFVNSATRFDFPLVVSFLMAALRGRGPYPIIVLLGEAGAAKSTLLRLLKSLVDPTKAPLRALPRENRDLFIAATNSYLIAFDNLSDLPDWLSDAFCRLATGGGFSTRQLYTNQEEQLFEAMRPVAMNAIENVVVRGDLADRSMFIRLERISEQDRTPEDELWAAFEAQRAGILGALLDAVAHGLRELPHTTLNEYPRMADFVKWMTACEQALWQRGEFAEAYKVNRAKATEDIIEADLVASAVIAFITYRAEHDDLYSWEGETKELLDLLGRHVTESQRDGKHWPKATNALSGRLTRAMPALRKSGIEVKEGRRPKTNRRFWTLTRTPPSPENDPLDPYDPSDGLFALGEAEKDNTQRPSDPSSDPYGVESGKDPGAGLTDSQDQSFDPNPLKSTEIEGSKDRKDEFTSNLEDDRKRRKSSRLRAKLDEPSRYHSSERGARNRTRRGRKQ
jgi:hypothetical protein